MAGIVAVIAVIFSTIGAAIAVAAAAVASAVAAALAAIGGALVAAGSAVVGVITGVLTGVGLISAFTAGEIMATLGVLNVTAFSTFVAVGTFVNSIVIGFQAFLTVIRFTTLKQIHNIAYILSAEYRSMMNKVYGHISKLSNQLGLGPYTMMMIIENTRSVVASASAFMGRNYDLFEVSWLQQFHGAMKSMNVKLESYRDNPAGLINDLDNWITKPTIDQASRFQVIILQTVEKITEGLEEITNRALRVRDDLEQLVNDLPEEIRHEILPRLKQVTKYVDDFIGNKYGPNMALLNQSIDVLKGRQEQAKDNINGIVDRLLRPGDYLLEIDTMSETARLEQELKLEEVTTRQSRRDTDKLTEHTSPAWAMLLKLQSALGLKLEKVAWHVPEVVDPGRTAMSEAIPRATWFVGEY